jgi:CHAP domain
VGAVHRILSAARSELGYSPEPDGRTKFGAWYARAIAHGDQYFVTAPWCDMFVSWCAHKAGVASQVGQFAATMSHAAWFRHRHHWHTQPHVGAIVFFNFPGHNPIDHVGLVEWVRNDGSIVVLEGNAGSPSKVRRTPYSSFIVGYGYPGYPPA